MSNRRRPTGSPRAIHFPLRLDEPRRPNRRQRKAERRAQWVVELRERRAGA